MYGMREPIRKSNGSTRTEHLLSQLCDDSFLRLWSYSNPYKDDGDELCDLIAVFGSHVFVFFDRERLFKTDSTADLQVEWLRWHRKVIEDQKRTAHGAEKYLRSGRTIYLDSKGDYEFPVRFDPTTAIYHKIIIAHGIEEAVLSSSEENVTGSLAICYEDDSSHSPALPFFVSIERENPIHILDSANLSLILGELDTFFDFREYFDAKMEALRSVKSMIYCGEEDLLAHFLQNYDELTGRHFIGVSDSRIDTVVIEEGLWSSFTKSKVYLRTKKANAISYFWDEILQHTCQNALQGVLLGNGDPLQSQGAIVQMAKEPRFARRDLSQAMIAAIQRFPDFSDQIHRSVCLMPSFRKNVAYVFLQLWVPYELRDIEYRAKRQSLLEIACGAARLARPELQEVIGIAIDAPKFARENAEDFLYMPCQHWNKERSDYYEKLNAHWRFFQTDAVRVRYHKMTEFI